MQKVYNTAQVSEICGVDQATVEKWYLARWLKGYQLIGTERKIRIPKSCLVSFLKKFGERLRLPESALVQVEGE